MCGCNRSVNVNDTDPRRRVRSAKPSRKPRPGTPIEPSPAAPRYAPGPRPVLARPRLVRKRLATRRPRQRIAQALPGSFVLPVGGREVGPALSSRPYPRPRLGLCASSNSHRGTTLPLSLVPYCEPRLTLRLLSIFSLNQSPDFLRYRMNRLTILDRLSVLIRGMKRRIPLTRIVTRITITRIVAQCGPGRWLSVGLNVVHGRNRYAVTHCTLPALAGALD